MTTYEASVDIDLSLVIDSAEVEHNLLLAPRGRCLNGAVVPDTCDDILVLHARQLALRTERHDNLAVEAVAIE